MTDLDRVLQEALDLAADFGVPTQKGSRMEKLLIKLVKAAQKEMTQ